MEKAILTVHGMSCEHCVAAITRAVTSLPGIGGVEISLETKTVTVEHDSAITSLERIKNEIDDQGYEVVG